MTADFHRAATGSVVFVDRPDRRLFSVEGRSPGRMLNGILSGPMPPGLEEVEPGVARGHLPCSAILTPKGKIVSTLRVGRLSNGETGVLLLDFPGPGLQGARDHLTRYLPPRFARLEEPAEPLGMLTVIGPEGADLLSREALGLRVDSEVLERMDEGEERILQDGSAAGIRVVRNREVHPFAADMIASQDTLSALRNRLDRLGIARAPETVRETLRVEWGRPAFGIEIDEETLPPEAGIEDRCIDHRKGCYTGQEVIVRIRDRGQVNRRLRGLLLGTAPLPAPGTPLFQADRDRPVGEVRSATASPAFGEGVALAYLRREVEPPAAVQLGTPNGPEVQARALSHDGWVLVEGDPTPYP